MLAECKQFVSLKLNKLFAIKEIKEITKPPKE